jgi:hypothetical protein
MRLDAHQHFWSYDAAQYPWIPPGSPLHRSWLPDDLATLQKPLGFDGSIAVQARQVVGESDWLLGLADKHANVKGVVGWVDLRSDRVEADLARDRVERVREIVGGEQRCFKQFGRAGDAGCVHLDWIPARLPGALLQTQDRMQRDPGNLPLRAGSCAGRAGGGAQTAEARNDQGRRLPSAP